VDTIMEVRGLTVGFPVSRELTLRAVEDAYLNVDRGKILGIVGESGSGKSTMANALMGYVQPPGRFERGEVKFRGVNLISLSEVELRKLRWSKISMVPQASQNVLNPTMRLLDQFQDVARSHGLQDRKEVEERASRLFTAVGLTPGILRSYPHELSGGMKQRVLIALSLLLDPEVIVLDEPTSALDVVTQRQILAEVRKLRDFMGKTLVFITHDITLETISDWLAVMYTGKVVEVGPTKAVFNQPLHPYTKALLSSVPKLTGDMSSVSAIKGEPPNPLNPPKGCRFNPRCPYVMEKCIREEPKLTEVKSSRWVACHLY
jgi:peptide/nickel transport system ATP-binding protein